VIKTLILLLTSTSKSLKEHRIRKSSKHY